MADDDDVHARNAAAFVGSMLTAPSAAHAHGAQVVLGAIWPSAAVAVPAAPAAARAQGEQVVLGEKWVTAFRKEVLISVISKRCQNNAENHDLFKLVRDALLQSLMGFHNAQTKFAPAKSKSVHYMAVVMQGLRLLEQQHKGDNVDAQIAALKDSYTHGPRLNAIEQVFAQDGDVHARIGVLCALNAFDMRLVNDAAPVWTAVMAEGVCERVWGNKKLLWEAFTESRKATGATAKDLYNLTRAVPGKGLQYFVPGFLAVPEPSGIRCPIGDHECTGSRDPYPRNAHATVQWLGDTLDQVAAAAPDDLLLRYLIFGILSHVSMVYNLLDSAKEWAAGNLQPVAFGDENSKGGGVDL